MPRFVRKNRQHCNNVLDIAGHLCVNQTCGTVRCISVIVFAITLLSLLTRLLHKMQTQGTLSGQGKDVKDNKQHASSFRITLDIKKVRPIAPLNSRHSCFHSFCRCFAR
jgi:hypothetical protein